MKWYEYSRLEAKAALAISWIVLMGVLFPLGPPHFRHWEFWASWSEPITLLGVALILVWPKKQLRCKNCGHRHRRVCKKPVYVHGSYYNCGCEQWVSPKP